MKVGELFFGKVEVSKDLKRLLWIGGLYALSVALSNTFVNVFLWKQKEDYLAIALFNLSMAIVQPLIFILGGKWAKQIDRVIVLRLGVFFLSAFYLTVLLIDKQASQYVILLGSLLGIGFGFYWLAFNLLTFEITEPETRDIFNGSWGLISSLANMLGPFFAGWFITKQENLQGYTFIFALSLGLFILAVIISFSLQRRLAEGAFQLKEVFSRRNSNNNWYQILGVNFFHGIREGTLPFLITIWIYQAAGSEMGLGTYSLLTSAISLVVFYLAGRFLAKKYRKQANLFGGILLSLAIFLLLIPLTYTRLIWYGIFVSVAFPFFLIPLTSITYDVIGQQKQVSTLRVEYIVARELALNLGRMLSLLFFMGMVSLLTLKQAFPVILLVLGNSQLFLYLFLRKVDIS